MRLDDPQIPSGSPSWPPSLESPGEEGLVPASVSPPVGLGTGLGMASFSVDSYALRSNQLEYFRDGWEGGRYLQDGGSLSLEESIHSYVVLNVPGGR